MWHRIARIDTEIHQDLVKLGRISKDWPHIPSETGRQVMFWEGLFKQFQHFLGERSEPHRNPFPGSPRLNVRSCLMIAAPRRALDSIESTTCALWDHRPPNAA